MHYMILGEGELLSGRGCQAGVFCHNMMIQGAKGQNTFLLAG